MSIDVHQADLRLDDGRTLHTYDIGPRDARLAVMWHHGTPNIGLPPEPLFPAAEHLGLRWISYDRPGYGGSTAAPGRNIASAAGDASRVADALGIERFAVMGHSGGSPHALACGALLKGRVDAVISVAALAPFDAAGLDWFAGMGPSGVASLRAAVDGRAAKERHEAAASDAAPDFTPEDWAALEGAWSWFGKVVRPALKDGPGPLIDDDLAYVASWGFDPAAVTAPVLLLHGGRDRIAPSAHSVWLSRRCPSSELWVRPQDGHISILKSADAALEWLAARH